MPRLHLSDRLHRLSARGREWLSGLRSRLLAAVAHFLTQPLEPDRLAWTPDPEWLSAALRHGDVLLTEGNTRAAALIKRVTGSTWSHVAMYVGPLEDGLNPRCIVEADIAAGVRSIRVSELDPLNLRVLRATGLSDPVCRRLAGWVVGQIGSEYDVGHAWLLATTFLRLPARPRSAPAQAPDGIAQRASRFVCSSLLAQAFALVGCPIVPAAVAGGLRPADHRDLIPADFARALVFEVVRPPARSAAVPPDSLDHADVGSEIGAHRDAPIVRAAINGRTP